MLPEWVQCKIFSQSNLLDVSVTDTSMFKIHSGQCNMDFICNHLFY